MNCDQAKGLLPEYLAGDLPRGRRAKVAAHLDGCATCRAELQALSRVDELLGTVPRAAPPSHLWAAVEARLDAPVARQPRRLRLALAGATVLLLALVLSLKPQQEVPDGHLVAVHYRVAAAGALGSPVVGDVLLSLTEDSP